MTDLRRDRLTGVALLLIALAWVAASIYAIPDGFSGSAYGPRSFPLWLGVLLAVLSLAMIAASFRGAHHLPDPTPSDVADEDPTVTRESERWAAGATFGFLLLLLGSMSVFGFLLSTVALVAAFLWFVLKSRSVPLTVLLSLGLGVGIWYAMSRFLGVYLPTGLLGI
jgi:putative tricarboxylic transport membrane protein